jgi:hypothetical protein
MSAATFGDAINWAVDADRGQRAPLDAFDWPSIARQTIDAYRTIAENPI